MPKEGIKISLIDFCYGLKGAGLPVGIDQMMELIRGVKMGLAPDVVRFFLLARLIFVKRLEHFSLFQEAFLRYILGIDGGELLKLLGGKPLHEWLRLKLTELKLTLE